MTGGAGVSQAGMPLKSMLRIDHVIVGVDRLESAASRFLEEYGLTSVEGGVHPKAGTANRIVPLGDAYIELLAVVDQERASAHPLGRLLLDSNAEGNHLVGWMVATDDLDSVTARLRLSPVSMFRLRPDGKRLAWRLAGLEEALRNPALPTFIQWDSPPEEHPGRTPVRHPVPVRRLESLEVSCPPETLDRWLGDSDLPIHVVPGDGGLLTVTILRADGDRLVL